MRKVGLGLLILLAAAGSGLANDTSYEGQGETVWAVGNDQIEMVSEKVVINYNLKEDKFFTDCLFEFKNTGGPTEVTVGFPDHTEAPPWEEGEKEPTITDFRCWADGKEVPTQIKAGIPSPVYKDLTHKRVFVWPMSFKGGETHKVRNTYSFRGMSNVLGRRGADYILRTGKTWRGVIGKAEIVVQGIEEEFFVSASPGGYRRQGNRIAWHFDHFEPDSDIHVEFNGWCQQWLFLGEQMLKEKAVNSDSIYGLFRNRYFLKGDTGVPEKRVTEMEKKLLGRMPDGPLKDYELYRLCLTQGDTAQAFTRWLSSLEGRWKGFPIVSPDEALMAAQSFKVRFHPPPLPLTPAEAEQHKRPPGIKAILMRNAELNPDTGRFVHSLKAIENYYLAVWDTSQWFYGWPRLAVEYRGIGKFDDALRCYEHGIAYKKRSALVLKIPVDTAGIAEIDKDMGQTMLYAGDTTRAIPYLEKAMEYPKTPGGGVAESMLKRIKERREK